MCGEGGTLRQSGVGQKELAYRVLIDAVMRFGGGGGTLRGRGGGTLRGQGGGLLEDKGACRAVGAGLQGPY